MNTNKHNFMQKLLFRELYGEVRSCRIKPKERLFNQLPHRLAFSLSQIAPASALAAGHIFLGFTKCGQFLLSYTRSCDNDNTIPAVYKYRLHWWLFVPYAPLKKVAEVILFGDLDLHESVYDNIQICICQWPNDLTKILVYGCSIGGDDLTGPQTRRVYLTITAVPSLNSCSACYKVATSFDVEDLVEIWNSCVRVSCLRHGFTVHSNFEIVQPFPPFMPSLQMRKEGLIVLNAGNFLHVLSVNLENLDKKIKDVPSIASIYQKSFNYSEDDSDDDSPVDAATIGSCIGSNMNKSPDQTRDDDSRNPTVIITPNENNDLPSSSLEARASNSTDRDREWEIFVASVPNSSMCNREQRCSEIKRPKLENAERRNQTDGDLGLDSDCSSSCSDFRRNVILPDYNLGYFSPYRGINDESAAQDSDTTVCSHTTEDELGTPKNKISNLFKSPEVLHSPRAFTRSRGGKNQKDNEYDFIDEISECSHEKLSAFRRRRLADKKYEFSDENSENVPQNYRSFRNRLMPSPKAAVRSFHMPFAQLSVELGEGSDIFRTMYEKLLSPSSSPNDVLRPINQNIASPVFSPRDGWKDNCDNKSDKYELQNWSSRESLNVYSPVPLSQRNIDQASQVGSFVGNASVKTFKCIVDIERRYFETEDELVSIITDVEDDDLSSATGYHNALPLEVHGSGYTQMNMISRSKAEKLMAPGILVKQVSLDVEQFCHETAQKLCLESGRKYYFCNDYNVEIIDVCSTTGNIVALASVLLQAGSLSNGQTPKPKLPAALGQNHKKLFKMVATFLFDITNKTYLIIDHEQLIEQDPYSLSQDEFEYSGDSTDGQWWQSATLQAKKLRMSYSYPTSYYSSVKVMTNEPLLRGKSLTHIMEGQHLVAIVL